MALLRQTSNDKNHEQLLGMGRHGSPQAANLLARSHTLGDDFKQNPDPQILAKNKDDIDTLIGKGITLNKTGKHNDAISVYKKVLMIDARNVDSLMNLAITYNYLQKYTDAINYYDKVQDLTQKFSNIPFEKSKAFEALGKTDDAFLAAQGIRLQEAESIKTNAKSKNYSVQHAYELKRFHELSKLKDNDSN